MKCRPLAVFLAVVSVALVAAVMPGSARAAGWSCLVPGPGSTYCAGTASFSSYYRSIPFQPIQASPGNLGQEDILISFSSNVQAIRVWANDPDSSGNTAEAWSYACSCWTPITSIYGDGVSGVFSVGGGGGIQGGTYSHVLLHSDPNDYVNWRVEYQRVPSSANWCKITLQTFYCDGVTATSSPFHQGSNFDPFQAVNNGTGVQAPIWITFQFGVLTVSATAVDPDLSGTRMEAYSDNGSLVGTVYFDYDNRGGWTTTSTKSITSNSGIKRVALIPNELDYVVFQGLTVTPFF